MGAKVATAAPTKSRFSIYYIDRPISVEGIFQFQGVSLNADGKILGPLVEVEGIAQIKPASKSNSTKVTEKVMVTNTLMQRSNLGSRGTRVVLASINITTTLFP